MTPPRTRATGRQWRLCVRVLCLVVVPAGAALAAWNPWDNHPLTGGDPIRAEHINELRNNVNDLRENTAAYPNTNCTNLPAFNFGANVNAGDPIRASHITQLIQAINETRFAIDGTTSFSPPYVAAGDQIQAAHIMALRNAMDAMVPLCQGGGGPLCPNGVVNPGEGCDDNNAVNGDGCSSTCCREVGQACGASNQCCSNNCSGACQPSASCNGDGICDAGEDASGCPSDCPPCRDNGDACSFDAQCCANNCQGGVCTAACKNPGIGCSSDGECCSHVCTGGACSCLAEGEDCTAGGGCCSSSCMAANPPWPTPKVCKSCGGDGNICGFGWPDCCGSLQCKPQGYPPTTPSTCTLCFTDFEGCGASCGPLGNCPSDHICVHYWCNNGYQTWQCDFKPWCP